jgi:hypothetical protein
MPVVGVGASPDFEFHLLTSAPERTTNDDPLSNDHSLVSGYQYTLNDKPRCAANSAMS